MRIDCLCYFLHFLHFQIESRVNYIKLMVCMDKVIEGHLKTDCVNEVNRPEGTL